MSAPDTDTRLLAQLRTMLDLTHTEIQIAETRVAQARTHAVRTELSENANNGRIRAEAIQKEIRDLGGFPDMVGPFVGRAAAAVKALTEQAQPFDEALLGDLALEDQLLDRARYINALAVASKHNDVQQLADRLITAHAATVNWLTTVLAEEALGGPPRCGVRRCRPRRALRSSYSTCRCRGRRSRSIGRSKRCVRPDRQSRSCGAAPSGQAK